MDKYKCIKEKEGTRGLKTMKQKKPEYDSKSVQGELIEKICSFFGRVYDDFEEERHQALRGHRSGEEKREEIMMGDPTINETAEEFDITSMKVRKLLITGGCYDTEMYREVKRLKEKGMSVEQIAEKLQKKPGTIRSYLPYERVIYNLEERTVNADRLQRFKQRWGGYKKDVQNVEEENGK